MGLDFVRLADLLRSDGAEPYKELVDSVRTRFPGRGHAYDEFIEQLRPLASGFVTVPALSYDGRSSTIRYWLNEAAQGRGQNFKPVLLRWFWKHNESWMREFLSRWQSELVWSDDQFALPSTDSQAEWFQVKRDVIIAHVEDADSRPLIEIAELLNRKGMTVGLYEVGGKLTDSSFSDECLFVLYMSRFNFENNMKNLENLESHFDQLSKALALFSDSARNLIILDQDWDHVTHVRADKSRIGYLELPVGIAAVVSALEQAALKLRIGNYEFQKYHETLCEKNTGQEFLEHGLSEMAESRPEGISLTIFDIDMTNQINRRFGDDIGDMVISETLNSITEGLKSFPSDVGRCGDDTFYAAIYDGFNREADMRRVNQEIGTRNWAELIPDLRVTCSAGYAGRKPNEAVRDVVIKAALGLEAARKNGGNQLKAGLSRIPNATSRHVRHHFS